MSDPVADAVTGAAAKAAADAPAGWADLLGGWAKLIAANFVAGITLPTVVLLVMIAALAFFLAKLQYKDNFDYAVMLQDEAGRPSPTRLAILISCAFSSWALMQIAISHPEDFFRIYLAYLATWSSSAFLVECAKKWDGRLPWAKSGQ